MRPKRAILGCGVAAAHQTIRRCTKMAKNTGKYEVLYIINATLGEDETKEVVEKFKTMVEENGTLISIDEWGKRRLA